MVNGLHPTVAGSMLALLIQRCDDDISSPAAAVGAATCLVDADPVEPCEELGVTAKAGQPTPGAQERLLRDLLRLVATGAQPHDDRVQTVGMAAHELVKRGPITLARERDKRMLILGHPRRRDRAVLRAARAR